MRWTATAGLLLSLLLVPGCLGPLPPGDIPAVRGPLAARVMHPILLTQLELAPRRAAIQPEGSWGGGGALAYMSIFERRSRDGERVVFDGEQLRTRVLLRRGVGASTDVEGELAAIFASSGFLDDFVNEFHDLFGFPGGGGRTPRRPVRGARPQGRGARLPAGRRPGGPGRRAHHREHRAAG